MRKKKVCSFGELLLRFSPDMNNDWLYNHKMPFYLGGAELNAASALANWHIPVKYITAAPDNYLSKQIAAYIHKRNVDSSDIIFSGNRIGIYYLPVGSELKHAGVIYDRAYSSFFELKPGMIDWNRILNDCSWFHFSAISPALNENVAAVCQEALQIATALGLTISVDLNYRAKLWQYGKQPPEIMQQLVKHCHVIMGNVWAVESLLGIASTIENSVGKTRQQLTDAAGASMLQLHKQYSGATTFAYTYRLDKTYIAVLQHDREIAVSKEYAIDEVADKVGSGDCFMAGLIYGLYHDHAPKTIIDYAAAAAVGKLLEAGDATAQTIEDVNKIINK